MSKALTAVLTMLVRSDKKIHRELERGLVLAYTPGSLNNGTHRLTLSRRGVFPSDQEIKIVKDSLTEVLTSEGRFPEIISVEPSLESKTKRGVVVRYHVLFWRERIQQKLL